MSIWSSEIKDLERLSKSIKGTHPELEKELERLIVADDENMLLVYSRRCLEVIITDLCEKELKRKRGTEPLQRIIDKLNKEEKVPHNIIISMLSVNSMSTFGAHPKEFELKQVKPVLSNLETIIGWYLKYRNVEIGSNQQQSIHPLANSLKKRKSVKKLVLISGVVLICAIIVSTLILTGRLNIGKQSKAKLIESFIILPFDNLTGDETLDDQVAGLHAMLNDDMQQVLSRLRILGTTTSNAYKDAGLTVSEITTKSEVDAVIESEVLSFGDSISIRFKLISSYPQEKRIWRRELKEEKGKIFNLFTQLSKNIAEEIDLKLSLQEKMFLDESRIVHPDAIDAYLKGQMYWEKLGKANMDSAIYFFNIAIDKDPGWATPYTGLALVWGVRRSFNYVSKEEAKKKRDEYLKKALELDPNSASSHYLKAITAVWSDWDWATGEKEFKKTLELNPNHALARLYYAHLLMILRRSEEAQIQAKKGLAADPMRPLVLGLYGAVLTDKGDYESAITHLEKALTLSLDADFPFATSNLLDPYYYSGEYKKWIEFWDKKTAGWNTEGKASVLKVFNENGHIAAIEEMFRMHEKFGKDCFMSNGIKRTRYLKLNNNEKAIDCLENMYDKRAMGMTYMATNRNGYEQLKQNPRYIELLKKMNLPLPEK